MRKAIGRQRERTHGVRTRTHGAEELDGGVALLRQMDARVSRVCVGGWLRREDNQSQAT